MGTLTTALTSARNDVIGKVSFFCKRFSCIFPYPKPVISSGGSMPYDSTAKNRYSFDEPRNLSCAWECRAFLRVQEL